MRKAMIIGHSGQDGGYLFDLLKDKGYIVIGIGRSTVESYLVSAPEIVDILSPHQIRKLVRQYPVDEIYYLATHQHSAEMRTPDDYQLFSESFDPANFLGQTMSFLKFEKIVEAGTEV